MLRVLDPIRRKYVVLTPEEYVRQNFVGMLVNTLHYPRVVIANEIGLELNGTRKRCDTVVFGRNGKPLMIVEYKAPDIKLTQETFDQIVRYNMVLKAKYLAVSNGIEHFCCVADYDGNSYRFLASVPDYKEMR